MNRRISSSSDEQEHRRGETRRGAGNSASRSNEDSGLLAMGKWRAGRWGVGLVAALYVSFAVMVPSDAVGQGVGLVLQVFALIALLAWALWTCAVQPARWRVSWFDGLVWGLWGWIGVSAWVMAGQGNPRLTLNVFWIWTALVASYWLARQFLRTAEDCRAVVALMLAVAVIEGSLGLYQSTYARPRDLAVYEADPEAALRAAGVVAPEDSPLRAQFASRMRDTEPLGTFSLTNSLAGFLAPWLILALGIGLAMFQASATCSRAERLEAPTLRLHWAMYGIAFLLVATCLLLTKSRSAYLATLGGIALLVAVAARRRWRLPAWWWFAGATGTGALVAIATALGLLDRQVLTEARMSLGVRWEYWQSTWSMTWDHPWLGCGVGNFQNYYATYKLPQASETVADPHNWFFETAANAGWLAGVLLASFLAAILVRLAAPPLFGRVALTDQPPENAGRTHVPTKVRPDREGEGSGESARAWAYVGFGAGLILAVVASLLSQFVPELFLLFVAMPIGGAMVWSLRPWVRHGELPSWAVGVALVVLVVNLSAAGSMTFAGVAGTLWLLAACGLRLHELESPAEDATSEWLVRPRAISYVAPLLAGAMLIGCVVTAYRPVMLGSLDLRRGDSLTQLGESSGAVAAHLEAAARDPWSYEPWQRLAGIYAQAFLRDPESEPAWQDLEHAVAEALRRNQHSQALHRELGDLYLTVWRQTGDERALRRAAESLDAAVGLYPNSNILHAQSAWVRHLQGRRDESRREAEEALRLDGLNHHREQKLGKQRLSDVRSRFPGQPAPPTQQTADQVMRRLVTGP